MEKEAKKIKYSYNDNDLLTKNNSSSIDLQIILQIHILQDIYHAHYHGQDMITTTALCTAIQHSPSGDVSIISFQVTQKFDFQAGQFVLGSFLIGGQIVKRSYSIYSSPQDLKNQGRLDLLVKIIPEPYVSKYLTQDIQINDEIQITGPLGHLTISPADKPKILFLSIGSGVTPIACMMQDLIQTGNYSQIINCYGERYRENIPDHTWNLFQMENEKLVSHIYLSQNVAGEGYRVGHIQDGLEQVIAGLDDTWQIVICGKPSFVDEMVQILISHGIEKGQIKAEKY